MLGFLNSVLSDLGGEKISPHFEGWLKAGTTNWLCSVSNPSQNLKNLKKMSTTSGVYSVLNFSQVSDG